MKLFIVSLILETSRLGRDDLEVFSPGAGFSAIWLRFEEDKLRRLGFIGTPWGPMPRLASSVASLLTPIPPMIFFPFCYKLKNVKLPV